MTFTYNAFKDGQADDSLWSKITNKLNSLNKEQSESVKIAASDMKGKDARAVIIYCNSPEPSQKTLGTTWNYKVFETSTDYDDMYAECVKFLNKSGGLSEAQRYYARMTMTNSSGHDSRLVLFYRQQN